MEFERNSPPGSFATSFSSDLGFPVVGTDSGAYFRGDSGWVEFAPSAKYLMLLNHSPVDGRWLYAAQGEIGWLKPSASGIEREVIKVPKLDDPFGSVRDRDGSYWIEQGSGRVARLKMVEGVPSLESFNRLSGLLDDWVQVFEVDGRVGFNVGDNILRFDEASHAFVKDEERFRGIPDLTSIVGRPTLDSRGNLWVADTNGVYVSKRNELSGKYERVAFFPGSSPYRFTCESDGVVWMQEESRLLRFDPTVNATQSIEPQARILSIVLPGSGRTFISPSGDLPRLDYSDNSLVATFDAPGSGLENPLNFEVMLEGSDTGWSSVGFAGVAVYNHLKERSYVLHVRPRLGAVVGTESSLGFIIDPPWFRTIYVHPEPPELEEPILAPHQVRSVCGVPRVVGPREVAPGRLPEVGLAVRAVAGGHPVPAVDEDPVHPVAGHDLPLHGGHELEVVGAQGAGEPEFRRGPVAPRLPVGADRDPVRVSLLDVVVGGVGVGAGDDGHAHLPAPVHQLAEHVATPEPGAPVVEGDLRRVIGHAAPGAQARGVGLRSPEVVEPEGDAEGPRVVLDQRELRPRPPRS